MTTAELHARRSDDAVSYLCVMCAVTARIPQPRPQADPVEARHAHSASTGKVLTGV